MEYKRNLKIKICIFQGRLDSCPPCLYNIKKCLEFKVELLEELVELVSGRRTAGLVNDKTSCGDRRQRVEARRPLRRQGQRDARGGRSWWVCDEGILDRGSGHRRARR